MKTLLLTCDFEEFSLPMDFGKTISADHMLNKSLEGMYVFRGLLSRHNIRATFFVTVLIAHTQSYLLKELIRDGHEIGLHCDVSPRDGCHMDDDTIANYIKDEKNRVEDTINYKMVGFRSHKLICLRSSILRNAGFLYDNSLHPTYMPGRYAHFFKSRAIRKENDVIRLPISVTPIIRLPFSWIWFRNFGKQYAQYCSSWVFRTQDFVNLYFHSWDFSDLGDRRSGDLPFFITCNSGKTIERTLSEYIVWCKKKANPIPIKDYLILNKYIAR